MLIFKKDFLFFKICISRGTITITVLRSIFNASLDSEKFLHKPVWEPLMILSQEKLEKHLWAASNILRGSVDAVEYKNYIFGLLFLKRLNDVFEEEVEKLVQQTDDPENAWENPEGHEFFIPKVSRWDQFPRMWYQDIGQALNEACQAIEEHNPTLKGILTSINFRDQVSPEVLSQLIEHFSLLRLRNCDLSDPDMLGRAYEYLIAKFSERGKIGGEFYTPHNIVVLLVKLLSPKEGMWICDPCAGSGGMLIHCVEYLGRKEKLSLFGQEKNIKTWALCKMNMLLHGIQGSHQIEIGDTIREPRLVKDGQLLQFDIVLSNPPFSLKNWGIEVAENDVYNRFTLGIPPNSFGDLAFLQHMLATLRPNGKMGIVFPHGILFRGGAEKRIRKNLIESDLVESIIGLPSNLFFGTSIPVCIVLINKAKIANRKRKILFIDSSDYYKEEKTQNILGEKDIVRIVNCFENFESIKYFSNIISLKEIRDMNYNLNIPLYVDSKEEGEIIDITKVIAELKLLGNELQIEKQQMMVFFEKIDTYERNMTEKIPETWSWVRLGDLIELETGKRAKGGALKEGTVASIGGEHISNTGKINWKNIKFIPEDFYNNQLVQGKVKKGDILVCKDGATTGKVAYITDLPFKKVAVNEHVFIVRVKETEVLDAEYLYHILFSEIGQKAFKRRYHGIVGGINRTDFNTIQIPLPSLEEQRRIVKVLSVVESNIRTSSRILNEQFLLKKGLMQHLLLGRLRLSKDLPYSLDNDPL